MPDFYDNQQDYIDKLNAMADAFHAGPFDSASSSIFTDAIVGYNASYLRNGDAVLASGRTAAFDGGGGEFFYAKTGTQTVDNGIVFAPSAGGGRIIRRGYTVFGFNGPIRPEWYGAKGDFVVSRPEGLAPVVSGTDDKIAIQAAFNAVKLTGGGEVELTAPGYKTTAPIMYNASDLKISSRHGSVIWPSGCDGLILGNPDSATYTSNRRNNISVGDVTVNMEFAPGFRGCSVYATDEFKTSNLSTFRGRIGIHLIYTYNVTLFNTVSIMASETQLDLDGACDKTVVIRGQYGNSGGRGVIVRGGKAITFIGASIERNQGEGILGLAGNRESGAEWGDGLNIIGCYIERNCQSFGEAFVSLGSGLSTVSDYSKGNVVSGNYFNFDAGNPANPATVPFIRLGKCSETSVNANRYVNSSNYINVSSDAFKKRIYLADISAEQAQLNNVRCEVPASVVPVSGTLTTDGTGFGQFNLDLTAYYTFANSTLALMLENKGTAANLSYTKVNPQKYLVTVRNGPVSSTIGFSGMMLGF
jgi:hypothetical protein